MILLLQLLGREVTTHYHLDIAAYRFGPLPPYTLEPFSSSPAEEQVILQKEDEGYTLIVNGTNFPVLVNREPVKRKKLASGDIIRFDENVSFLYLAITASPLEKSTQAEEWEWTKQYRKLKDRTQKLYSAEQFSDLLPLLLEETIRLTGMERGFIILCHEGGKIDSIPGNNVYFSKPEENGRLTVPSSVIEQVIKTGECVLILNKDRKATTRFPEIKAFPLQSLICHPLKYKHQTVAILYLDANYPLADFRDAHRLLFTVLMDHAAIAIENIKISEETNRLHHHLKNKFEESEKRFRQIVELSPDAIFVHSDERLVYINPAGVKMLGAEKPAELLGKPVLDLIHPDYHELVKKRIDMELETETPVPLIEEKLIRLDGEPVSVEVTAASIPYDGRTAALVVARDITEKLLIAEERLKSQKAESLTTLAGGIAHDFNNILTAILGYLSLAKTENLMDTTKLLNDLENAEKGALRAKSLTQQLLTFAKGETLEKKVGNIASLIRETVPFLLHGSAVRLELSIDEDLWHVQMDEGQIGQVISNLTINAVQAMPDGGIIRVTGGNAQLDKKNPLAIPGGKYVKISFQDTGTGVPKSILSKIFDPYFTTKETGSGLGLATSISIVKRHNGTITVDSTPGKGSTFTLYLPASSQKIEEPEEDSRMIFPGKGKILVMDDEESVQNFARTALTNLGYEVKIARDGKQAIDLYREALAENVPFDVVIIDLTIPGGMGGRETIRELRELDSDVKAVVSSGYSTEPILANYRAYGFDAILEKPYRVGDLSEVLKSVLSRKAAESKGR